jgi:hypothetical protein
LTPNQRACREQCRTQLTCSLFRCFNERKAESAVLAALRQFIADHEASGRACEGLNAAYFEAKAALAAVEAHE